MLTERGIRLLVLLVLTQRGCSVHAGCQWLTISTIFPHDRQKALFNEGFKNTSHTRNSISVYATQFQHPPSYLFKCHWTKWCACMACDPISSSSADMYTISLEVFPENIPDSNTWYMSTGGHGAYKTSKISVQCKGSTDWRWAVLSLSIMCLIALATVVTLCCCCDCSDCCCYCKQTCRYCVLCHRTAIGQRCMNRCFECDQQYIKYRQCHKTSVSDVNPPMTRLSAESRV